MVPQDVEFSMEITTALPLERNGPDRLSSQPRSEVKESSTDKRLGPSRWVRER